MGAVHAIDFGTSTSSIMIARPGAAMLKIRDPGSPQGAHSVRSAVCGLKDGSVAVGEAAYRARVNHAGSYRSEFKRDFGDPTTSRVGDRNLRPDEMAGHVIGFLRTLALRQVPDEPEQVVLTVPAAWEKGNRDLMRRSAEAAGYRSATVRLVSEPEAAGAYASAGAPGERTLVYDLGGGTFDCAVARVCEDGHEVLGAPGGRGDVGGGEFDRRIMTHIRVLFPDAAAALFDPARTDTDTLRRRIQLRERCEQIKMLLSVIDSHEEQLVELRPPPHLTLTRADLAELIDPLLEETLVECERLLGSLGMGWADVDRIVPVGGSSRLPIVTEKLEKRSGRTATPVDDPDLAVVHGAALLAAADAWPPPPPPPPDPFPPPTPPRAARRFDPDRNLYDD